MKFLQLNLGRGKEAQNLLMQTAKERGADVLLINKQHKWSENSTWYQVASRRAGILVCSADLNIGDFLETDAGFVWVEVAGCVCTPVNPLPMILSRSSRPRSFSSRKASVRLVAGPLSRATLIVSRPSWAKPV